MSSRFPPARPGLGRLPGDINPVVYSNKVGGWLITGRTRAVRGDRVQHRTARHARQENLRDFKPAIRVFSSGSC